MDDPLARDDSIQLWNPVIKQKLKLPMSPTLPKHFGQSYVVLGFGFDARNKDYKVVRICYAVKNCDYLYPPVVEVYSLSRGMWHTVEDRIRWNYYVAEYIWSQAFINGNVHWTAFKITGTNNKLENMIMSFDVTLEMFDEMRLPEALENEHPMNISVVDFGGSLAVVQYDNHRVDSKSSSIWVMKKYSDVESWSRDYNIYAGHEGGIRIGTILGLRVNGDVLMSSSIGGLVSHSCLSGVNVDFLLLGTNHSFYVGPYFESLVLLSDQSESDQELAGLMEFEII